MAKKPPAPPVKPARKKPAAKAAPAKRAPAAKVAVKAKPKAQPAVKKVRGKPGAPLGNQRAVGNKGGTGRPQSYKPEFAEMAYKICLLGATDERLAEIFGVCVATLNTWKLTHPDFSGALVRGKDQADAEIAHALFHRAKGYSHPEDDIRTVSFGPAGSEIVITPTIKHYPPDTPAASLWLRNRQPKIWRDKVDLEHTGKDGGPIQTQALHEMTDAQLLLIAQGGK